MRWFSLSLTLSSRLLRADIDPLLSLRLVHLRNNNAQDSVLHARRGIVTINRAREGEAAGESTHTSLRDPIGVLRFGFGGFPGARLSQFLVGGGSLIRTTVFSFSSSFDSSGSGCGLGAFLSEPLASAFHSQSLLIGKLNDNVLLVNTGEFAFKNIVIVGFLDVKFWCEDAGRPCQKVSGVRRRRR